MTRKISLFALTAALLFAVSCSKESKVIDLGDTIVSNSDTSTGYSLPRVTAIYPSGTGISTTTKAVVVFNIPIDMSTVDTGVTVVSSVNGALVLGTDYSLDTTGANYVIIDFTVGGNLTNSENIEINVLSTVEDRDNGNSLDITNSISMPVDFTTGALAETTAPTVTVSPVDGATNVAIAANVTATFSEALDPGTINGNTFYLVRDSDSTVVEAVISYDTGTYVATLNPADDLINDETYTVHLTGVIEDMSGNNLTGDTYQFTTVAVVDGTNPALTGNSPSIGSITTSSAVINWTTNEPTDYTVNYGTSSAFGDTEPSSIFDLSHTQTLSGLTDGTRYYYNIYFEDESGNGTTSATYQFNTQTSETPTVIANGAGNQIQARYIPQKAGVANSGAFVFWDDLSSGYYQINGALYNSAFTQQWSYDIFALSSNYYYLSAVEDSAGGAIVLASDNSTGVYAKRIDADGSLNSGWGYTAGSTGVKLNSSSTSITKAYAAPVYSGIVNQLTYGTTEMNNLASANIFFDFDVNFTTSGVADGDLVVDTAGYDISTVDYQYSDFYRHSLYQAVDTVDAGGGYRIVDVSISSSGTSDFPLTLADNVSTVYISTHVYTAPGWLSFAAVPNGDIMEVNGEYVYITGINSSFSGQVDSGTNEYSLTTSHLVDAGQSWGSTSQPVEIGDTVENTDTSDTAIVTAVSGSDLTLNNDIFATSGGEGYEITGTADEGTTGPGPQADNHLSVFAASWGNGITGPVFAGDIVENTTTSATTTVAAGGVTNNDLTLDADIFNGTNEGFHIYHFMTGTSDSWTPSDVNYLYDSGASWGDGSTGPVYVGNTVYNTTDGTNATVTAVSNNQLTLSAARFNPAGGDNYTIYDTFYAFSVSLPVDIATDPAFVIYNNAAIATGTADAAPSNPLYDNDPSSLFTTAGVADGDIVLNFTDETVAEVDTGTGPFAVRPRALDLSSNIFANDEDYEIYESLNGASYSDIVALGTATGGTSTTLVDSGKDFSAVDIGDVVYNITDGLYAMVTGTATGTLTLSADATFSNNDRYIVVAAAAGVLYAWQEGTTVHWKVLSVDDPSTELYSEQTIANARNPQVIPNGLGRAFLVYEDTSTTSNIVARLIDVLGNVTATVNIDTTSANESILKIISDGSGGIVILFNRNATNALCVQRLNSSGAVQYGGTGRTVGNPAAINTTIPVGDAVDMVYNSSDGSQIVVAQIGNDIWARRIGTVWTDAGVAAGQYISTLASSIQQKPKIYVDSTWTNARIVWEDNRFVTGGGYGIFGMQVNATTGVKSTAWDADTGAGTDMNGISIILNSENGYWPNVIVVPYNNNASANIIWDDYRNGTADLGYMSLP